MGFKKYTTEDGKKVEFTVFLIHGHSKELDKIERFIKDELNFNVIILQNDFSGKLILDKFREAIWDSTDCAIAIMSPDDKLENGNYRARQNVFYELGYCQAVFDSYYEDDQYQFEPVIVIKERTINFDEVSDLLGLDVINYTDGHIDSVFYQLAKSLTRIYQELSDNHY